MASPQHEPTMEEILASIRKIISEDSPSSTHETQPDGERDVLDLTQEVRETPSPEAAQPANTDCPEPAAAAHPSFQTGDGLFSDRTSAAVDEAVSGLSSAAAPGEETREAPLGDSVEETFERAVKEAFEPVLGNWLAHNSETMIGHMKPVIRDWLDEHFPAMLESAVKGELARARARNRRR